MVKRLILPVLLCAVLAACAGEREYTVASDEEFARVVDKINAWPPAETYRITLTADVTADSAYFYSRKVKKTITISGGVAARTIAGSGGPQFFLLRVSEGNTLVLENNVRLTGDGILFGAVGVDGGALVMKDGAVIEGVKNGGVLIENGGVFTMEDGAISGNTVEYDGGGVSVGRNGVFTMEGGTIRENAVEYGGGVYVYNGRFIKTGGGTIDGNTAAEGRAVYIVDGAAARLRNADAGPELDLDSGWGAGGWEQP
jgi:hypothetical protein